MTSIVTYLVMLMQFRLTLMRNAALAARRAKRIALGLGLNITDVDDF